MSTGRSCGTCTFCCKVMEVTELAKPVGTWCRHCAIGKGCGIYATRPAECATFVCQWLGDPELPEAMKPDKIKVMFSADSTGRSFVARCDPAYPLAWKNAAVLDLLKRTARHIWNTHGTVLATAGRRTWVITPAAEYDLGEIDPYADIAFVKRADGTAEVTVRPAQV